MADIELAIHRRLLGPTHKEEAYRRLHQMLLTLDAGGFLNLDPPPSHGNDDAQGFRVKAAAAKSTLIGDTPHPSQCIWLSKGSIVATFDSADTSDGDNADFGSGLFVRTPEESASSQSNADEDNEGVSGVGLLGQLISEARSSGGTASTREGSSEQSGSLDDSMNTGDVEPPVDEYHPEYAVATESLDLLFAFRSINPIFGVFLSEHLHRASHEERLLLLEAALDMPRSIARFMRVPFPEQMPPGPMAVNWANPKLLSSGQVTQDELTGYRDEDTGRRIPPLDLANKVQMLFRSEFPAAHDARVSAVWCVGDLLTFGGDFSKYVRARDLAKQEGLVFRHCLRMILLCEEFARVQPPGIDAKDWQRDLAELASLLTESCRAVDPSSTDETLTALEIRQQETSISL